MNKFNVICADPPWSFEDSLKQMKSRTKRAAVANYNTMSVSEICDIDVPSLVDPNGCVLALWVPSTLLVDGLRVMDAWGFKFKQTYIWVKTKKLIGGAEMHIDGNNILSFGMGRIFRQTHEIALIGTSGKSIYKSLKNKSQRSVSLAYNMGHSIKPENLQDSLSLMFPEANKLEMFARRQKQDWTCLGNELDGKDINDAILELKL